MSSPSTSSSAEDPLKAAVHEVLKKNKIKLWLEPYVTEHEDCCETALQALVQQWKADQSLPAKIRSETNYPRVIQAVRDFQAHSLAKYREKQQGKLRVAQSPTSVVATPRNATSNATTAVSVPSEVDLLIKVLGLKKTVNEMEASDLAERIEIVDKKQDASDSRNNQGNTKSPVVLRLEGVSTQRLTTELVQYLQSALDVSNVRLIHRGKNISSLPSSDKNDQKQSSTTESPALTLRQAISAAAAGNATPGKEISLLCIASTTPSVDDDPRMARHADLHSRITAIRDAALQIRDTTNLEITDQHGATVPMSKEDRLAFLTALALHRLGRSCTKAEEAIVFLLEADAEWSTHPQLLQAWADRVDNYGLLQLDIAWAYLRLESLSNLPDSLRRLEEAERVLRKQVNVNFVTLALTQADLGNYNEVPPLAAVFAKLFLLQGVAYLHDSSTNNKRASYQKGKERLDWAYSLLLSLRSVAPDDSVQSLMEAMGSNDNISAAVAGLGLSVSPKCITRSAAIAALRKSRGNLDAAANALAQEATERKQRHLDREVQRKYGLCQNEKDPVHLEQLKILKPMLQEGACTSGGGTSDPYAELSVALLRLANNDVNRALEIYQEQDYDAIKVQNQVSQLDQRLLQKGLLSRSLWSSKKKRKFDSNHPPVNEEALATLISMGVDQGKARTALQKNSNDIEKAQLWLFTAGSQQEQKSVTELHNSDSDIPKDSEAQKEGVGRAQDEKQNSGSKHSATDCQQEADMEDKVSKQEDEEEEEDEEGSDHDEEEDDALDILKQELGGILEERDIEKEYLGSSLGEEWSLIQKYNPST